MPRRSRKTFVLGTFPLTSDLLWKSFGEEGGELDSGPEDMFVQEDGVDVR